jgi:hypothetical protein
MADTRSNLQQFLKGKQLYTSLYAVCTEVLPDFTAVLNESAAKGETAKTTITEPPSKEKFRKQSRRKREASDDADKRTKKPATSAKRLNGLQLRSKGEVPTRNFFATEVN